MREKVYLAGCTVIPMDDTSLPSIFYVIIMLVVVVVVLYFVTGINVLKLFTGSKTFDRPSIQVSSGQSGFFATCSGSGYLATLSGLSINYEGKKEDSVQIYPVLDIGDNPILDDQGTAITCTYGSDEKFSCGKVDLKFTLNLNNLQSDNNLGSTKTYAQIYFFKKTDAIRQYLQSGGYGKTTTNLLNTYNDFYIQNVYLPSQDTSCIAQAIGQSCSSYSKDDCMSKGSGFCYYSVNSPQQCKICPTGKQTPSDCSNNDPAAQMNCPSLIDAGCAQQYSYS